MDWGDFNAAAGLRFVFVLLIQPMSGSQRLPYKLGNRFAEGKYNIEKELFEPVSGTNFNHDRYLSGSVVQIHTMTCLPVSGKIKKVVIIKLHFASLNKPSLFEKFQITTYRVHVHDI